MMGYDTGCRLYNSMCNKPSHNTHKGRKKKVRRMLKAWRADGWSRKRAGSMSPQFHTSRHIFQYEEE